MSNKNIDRPNKLPPGRAACNQLFSLYKNQAQRRNHEWMIDIETFMKITKERCFYCDKEPLQVHKSKTNGMNGDYVYNGIDRIDNNLGYQIGNIVACCGDCNAMKMSKTASEFLQKIQKILDICRNKLVMN